MTEKELIQLLVDNNIYNKRQAKAFVLDLTRTAHFSKAVRRVFDLKAILGLERRIEKVQFRKDGSPILWPSLATGIEKTEPEPEGQQDGRICKLLWPSISERNENA
jgi:hypothetical protein